MTSAPSLPLTGEDRGGYYSPQDSRYMFAYGITQKHHWTGESISVGLVKADVRRSVASCSTSFL
jgi:hypothetical protein